MGAEAVARAANGEREREGRGSMDEQGNCLN